MSSKYVVSVSDYYYPQSGCSDWETVENSLEKARQFISHFDLGRGQHWAIIEITDGNHFREVDWGGEFDA